MSKKVIITVTGSQTFQDQEQDHTELITEGEYSYRGGRGMIRYEESEITGMEGTTTQFRFTPQEVIITRKGALSSKMVFVEGKQNVFLYNTPYGSATLGIDTHKITSSLNEQGGELDIDYTMHFDRMMATRNRFTIKIKEQAVSEYGKLD